MRFTLLSLLFACSSSQPTGITATCDTTLTYANFGETFISDNCLSCHANKERPTLSTQAQVQQNLSKIMSEAVYSTSMPEDADMALADRQMLGNWLACGGN